MSSPTELSYRAFINGVPTGEEIALAPNQLLAVHPSGNALTGLGVGTNLSIGGGNLNASGGGGGGFISTNTIFVDKSGNDTTGTGSPSAPFLTIAKGISIAVSGEQVYVNPGNYSEGVIAKNGVYLYLSAGAVWTRATTGPTLTDNNVACVFYVSGYGSLTHADASGAQSVIEIQNDGTTFYIDCHEVTMAVANNSHNTSGTGYLASYGPAGGGPVHYQQSAIFVCNGYLQLNCNHIVSTNCPTIFRGGNGKAFITSGDEIESIGTGVSTFVIGDGTPGSAPTLEQPVWIHCKRFISDVAERVVSVEGNPYVMVLYVNCGRIAGNIGDPNVGGTLVFYLRVDFVTPRYFHDGSLYNSTGNRPVFSLRNPNSFYVLDIGDVAAENTILFYLNGGLSSVNSFIKVGRAYGLSSTTDLIVVDASTNITMQCMRLECDTVDGYPPNGITYNGGNFQFEGTIDWLRGSATGNPIKLTSDGLELRNTRIKSGGGASIIGSFTVNTAGLYMDSAPDAGVIIAGIPSYPSPTTISGVTISGTPSTGQVLTATGSSAADWQDPAGFTPVLTDWRFNDLTDSSGNGYNLTETGTGITVSSGTATFPGTADTLTASGFLEGAGISSFSLLINAANGVPGSTQLILCGSPGIVQLFQNADNTISLVMEGGFTVTSTVAMDGSPHKIRVRFANGGAFGIKVDNEAEVTGTNSGIDGFANWFIGDDGTSGQYFQGTMGETKLWPAYLSDAQFNSL